jgi:deferrochelatase/peroxidase EfeB
MELNLADIQGNLLRGYRFTHARHLALGITDPAAARQLLGDLVSGDEGRSPQITTDEHWNDRPDYRLNIGLTWTGLQALGVPEGTLGDFPPAFAQGPAARAEQPDPDFPTAVGLGDIGDSAPENWILGGPTTDAVHILLSLYTEEHRAPSLEAISDRLRKRLAAARLTEVWTQDANTLPERKVHFGYVDGIAQPEIEGGHGRPIPDMQPKAKVGDFLLGCGYVNSYGGNFIGNLPAALADNGSYGAFRILRQDVEGFERLLDAWAEEWGLERETVAAKLLGRWRNGTPLTLVPEAYSAQPTIPAHTLNNFDYAPSDANPGVFDDAEGRRCPIGSHIRRLNPRSSLVTGQPHTRRIVRRGMPYGPPYDPQAPGDKQERGLMGLFLCGDLELQYEFLLRVWANEDLATPGLRGTRDPIIGAQPQTGGEFTVRTNDGHDPIVMTGLPRLVRTRGSLYCFIPGIGGLRYLSELGEGAGA